MFKIFAILLIICGVSCRSVGNSPAVVSGLSEETKSEKNDGISAIKGYDKIQNEDLRKTVELIFNDESDDYALFPYFSKAYLDKFYPNIRTRAEYEKYLEDIEIYPDMSRFLEITECRRLSDAEYQMNAIKLAKDSPTARDWHKIKIGYSFVLQGGKWKYNGRIPGEWMEIAE